MSDVPQNTVTPAQVPAKRGPGRPRKSPAQAQRPALRAPAQARLDFPAETARALDERTSASQDQSLDSSASAAPAVVEDAPAQVRYYFRTENVVVARVYRVEGDMPPARAYTTVLRLGAGELPAGVTVAAETCTRREGTGPVHEIRADGVDDFVARIAAGNWR